MPYGIQIRGHRQYRAQVRRNGLYRSKTFETLQDAQQWRRITDGLLSGHQVPDNPKALKTTLAKACDWMLEGSRAGTGANADNIRSKLRYWKTTNFCAYPIASIFDWDLIEWRRDVGTLHAPAGGSSWGAATWGTFEPTLVKAGKSLNGTIWHQRRESGGMSENPGETLRH